MRYVLIVALVALLADAVIGGSAECRKEWARQVWLWDCAKFFQEHHANGWAFLEPIGIIGYYNPRMQLADEVGLATPWVAARRGDGPGWMADAFDRYRPEWILVLGRWLVDPMNSSPALAGSGAPFRSNLQRIQLLSRYNIEGVTTKVPGVDPLVTPSLGVFIGWTRGDGPSLGRMRPGPAAL